MTTTTEQLAGLGPGRLFRALARAEVVTWTVLLAGMVLKYPLGQTGLVVRVGGGLHGLVFLAYCAVTIVVAVDARWRARRTAAGLASAVVPYLSVVFAGHLERNGGLTSAWRLLREPGRSPTERLVATGLRRPGRSTLVLLILVVTMFLALLALGPPTTWGR